MEYILVISIFLNCVLLPYSVRSARRLLIAANNVLAVKEASEMFQVHASELRDSEMYYGDQSLVALVEHIDAVLDEIERLEEVYTLAIDNEEGEDFVENDKEETPPQD